MAKTTEKKALASKKPPFFLICIKDEFSRRMARNPNYSLRAFARSLDIPASTLSRALQGKRGISIDAAGKIISCLGLSPRESANFIASLSAKKKDQVPNKAETKGVRELSEEEFQTIADIHHYAILELTFVKGFQSNPEWIAKQLGIPKLEAQLALDRLLRLGFLKKINQRLTKTHRTLWSNASGQSTTSALRNYQGQSLSKAQLALEDIPFEKRTASAMTIPIDVKKLPLARQMIEDFSIELCRTLATDDMTDVYQLSINFHSLLKGTAK